MRFARMIWTPLLAVFCLLLSASAQNARAFKLEPLSPKFWDLVDRDAKLQTVATGFGFTEGPMWDPAGFLYVSDETINKIFRVYPNGKKEEVIALGDPDGNTFEPPASLDRLCECIASDHRGNSER
jgi:gluconolactonase